MLPWPLFVQAEDGIRDIGVTGVQTCALPISGERLGEDRLAGAGNVLDEDVAATDQGDERELDLVVLAEDDPLDVLDDASDQRVEGLIHRAYVPSSLSFRARPRSMGVV